MKHLAKHYIGEDGKFPGGRVHSTEDSFDVFDSKGIHQVAKRKNGAGQWTCVSEEHGCASKHDLSPTKNQVQKIIDRQGFHPRPQPGDENVCPSWGLDKKEEVKAIAGGKK